jgi:hypothetical protein
MLEREEEDVIVPVGHTGLLTGYRNISGALTVARVAPSVAVAICLVGVEDTRAIIINIGDSILV